MSSLFGQGIAFPPQLDGHGRLAWSMGESNIRASIGIILKTNLQERIALPKFGAGLGTFLFEPNNSATHARVAHAIERALAQWEPRIAVGEVTVAADPQAADSAMATITYKLVASGAAEKVTLSIPLSAQG